jgi:hypothetical protein
MSVAHAKIFKLDFTFVYHYRYKKNNEDEFLDRHTTWRQWELGLFFKRNKIVGRKNFNKPKEWSNNLVYEYMLGVNLLIWKMWFTVHKGGMSLELKDKK